MNSTVKLDNDTRALATINVSDPTVTIVFDVEPSTNVSLALMLSHGSPPTSTNSSNTTILSQEGNYSNKQRIIYCCIHKIDQVNCFGL